MVERLFHRNKPFLHIPVCDKDPESFNFIQVWDGERMDKEFFIGIADVEKGEKPDFYVAMYLGNYLSDSIILKCEDSCSDSILEGILRSFLH